VGMTANPTRRLSVHKAPTMTILDILTAEEAARACESWWINLLRDFIRNEKLAPHHISWVNEHDATHELFTFNDARSYSLKRWDRITTEIGRFNLKRFDDR